MIEENKIICIYKITSPTKKIYVGQTVDLARRIKEYQKLKCYKQKKLFASLQKYGWNKHKFEILHICDEVELNILEKYYVDLYQSFNTEMGMNLRDGGGHNKMSDSTKEKLRQANLGRPLSEEHKKKLSLAKIGKKPPLVTDSTRKKISEALKGKKKSKEHSAKLGIAKLGTKLTEDHKKKISEANRNRIYKKHTEETKLKMSISRKGRKLSNETKEKISIANKGKQINSYLKKHYQYIKDNINLKSQKEIAKDLGVDPSAISKYLKKWGV